MFVLGLLLGPMVGLGLGSLSSRSGSRSPLITAVPVALVLIFLLFAGFLDLELKLGLIAGVLLGLLIDATPMQSAA